MKPALPILALIATIALTEATDLSTIINLKSRIGKLALNTAASVIQAKQDMIRSSTSAIINAKTNFIQRQLPHFVQFKTNQINGVLELKKNLLKSKVATISPLAGGGNAIQAAEQDVAPFSPPAAPTAPVEEPLRPYIPQPSLPPQALPLPAEIPEGPYPPTSYLANRQQQAPVASEHAQASLHHQRESYQPIYSSYPTPPPPPPVQHILHV